MSVERHDDGSATFEVGSEQVTGDLLWESDFEPSGEYLIEKEGGTVEFTGEELEIDCTDGDGLTVWNQQEFPESIVLHYAATIHPPSEGNNLNCFFAASGGEEPLAESERSGAYNEYHELPNYIFTLTYRHTRMRRDPGFEQLSDLGLGAQQERRYEITVLKRDGHLQAAINGRLMHDVTDPDPHGSGWVALRSWNTKATYDTWAVYEPR
jgi:hypothetical protein